MPFDFAKAIEAVGNAFKSVSDCFKVNKEHQSETELLKDRKRLQKSVDYAEKIIAIMYKYIDLYQEKDNKELIDLVEKFYKYN